MTDPLPDIFGTSRQLSSLTNARLPVVVTEAGENATRRFLEFFTVTIRNRNTRAAYARAAWMFFDWCHDRGVSLDRIEPILVSLYIEEISGRLKQSREKRGKFQGDVHVKVHGCSTGEFRVLPNLPAELAQGLFAEERSFSAAVRFSNSVSHPQPDFVRDGRGMAMKLLEIAGERLSPPLLDYDPVHYTEGVVSSDHWSSICPASS